MVSEFAVTPKHVWKLTARFLSVFVKVFVVFSAAMQTDVVFPFGKPKDILTKRHTTPVSRALRSNIEYYQTFTKAFRNLAVSFRTCLGVTANLGLHLYTVRPEGRHLKTKVSFTILENLYYPRPLFPTKLTPQTLSGHSQHFKTKLSKSFRNRCGDALKINVGCV